MTLFELYTKDVAVRKTKEKVREAIAWGAGSNESWPMDPTEFIKVLKMALRAIEELEK